MQMQTFLKIFAFAALCAAFLYITDKQNYINDLHTQIQQLSEEINLLKSSASTCVCASEVVSTNIKSWLDNMWDNL